MEMMPPLDRWGTKYYDPPMAYRTVCGNFNRLIAGEDNVEIYENGMSIRRIVQIIAFVSALAFAFASPVSSNTAYACDPNSGVGGLC